MAKHKTEFILPLENYKTSSPFYDDTSSKFWNNRFLQLYYGLALFTLVPIRMFLIYFIVFPLLWIVAYFTHLGIKVNHDQPQVYIPGTVRFYGIKVVLFLWQVCIFIRGAIVTHHGKPDEKVKITIAAPHRIEGIDSIHITKKYACSGVSADKYAKSILSRPWAVLFEPFLTNSQFV